ncbi:MAG TPA: beta-propeller fold lactonase family protein [Acidobacteriaceae bacterium]|nr:beta-propeller fold lactonase family protein [Acidobacteriaceae bacterium]
MKLTRIGQGILATAASLSLGLGMSSCNPGNTIDYLFVTSNSANAASSGQVSSYHVNSYSGVLTEVTGSPFSSQGKNPVAAIATPDTKHLYVANHDSNSIAEFAIGTNGQLSFGHSYTTPGTEPVSLAMNTTGTLLFVADYYQAGFSDATPGAGALVVYPINSDGTLGTPVGTSGAAFAPLQCFPGGVAVSPDGKYAYATNTNSVIVTTSAPTTGTAPATPATCPAQGTISGFSVASNGTLTPLPGSPYSAGSTPTGVAIDPTSRFLYATDSVQNQLIAYQIQPSGSLYPLPNGPFTTGTFPVSVVVDPRGLFIYVSNYNSSTLSEYALTQSTGAPSAGAAASFGTKAPTPTCIVVDPSLGRYVYTTDFTGSYITAGELNPHTGELTGVQDSPFPAHGTPTCATAVPHGNHATQFTTATGL